MQVERLDPTATKDEIAAIVRRDGAVVVENFLSEARIEQIYEELRPFIDQTVPHKSEFGGYTPPRFVPGTPGALPPELALVDGDDVDLSLGDFPEANLF